MSWSILGNILLAIIVIGIIFVIILENRNPHKAVGWLIILVLLPGVGVLLYALLGREKRHLRKINRHVPERFDLNETPAVLEEESEERVIHDRYELLYNLIYSETLGSMLKADEVATFTNGVDKLYALLEDIKAAKEFIHIEYYRFLDDKSGKLLAKALKEKAAEGVKVRLLCDYVGSFTTRNSFFSDLKKHGVEVRQFLKVVFPSLRSDINFRNHRKIVVIDRNIGYLGGMNIADHYTFGNRRGTWKDAHFRITGLAVNGLQSIFMSDWYVASKIALSYDYFIDPANIQSIVAQNFSDGYTKAPKVSQVQMQTFTSGPTSMFRTLQQAWCRSIYEAKEHIYIETPYFLPTEALNKALLGAALSGVEVIMVLPWKNDSFFVKYAMQSYYEGLMEAGIKLYKYDGEFNHSKLMTIDGEICFIGSANMDFRSLEHNFEITSLVYDRSFALQIENLIKQDIETNCVPFDLKRWKKRNFPLRFTQSFFRLFSPLM